MVEVTDDMTTAEAILLLAEHPETLPEPERSFVMSVVEEAVAEMQAQEAEAGVMVIRSENDDIRESK